MHTYMNECINVRTCELTIDRSIERVCMYLVIYSAKPGLKSIPGYLLAPLFLYAISQKVMGA